MAGEGEFPKSAGDIAYASEANFFHNKILEVYTGSGFNTSGAEAEHELTAVTTSINGATYVKVAMTVSLQSATGAGSTGGTAQLKAQIKETDGAYADIISYKTVLKGNGPVGLTVNTAQTYEVTATLTAGMKANGFQIKVLATGGGGGGSSITNIQTVVEYG
jgi:hypothetical protein